MAGLLDRQSGTAMRFAGIANARSTQCMEKIMKNIIRTLFIASFAFIAVPTLANNWQWQLDQIKADQQRSAKRATAEQKTAYSPKPETSKPKVIEQDRKPAPNPPAK